MPKSTLAFFAQSCFWRNSVTDRVGGFVLGISKTVVTPPMAAALVPVSQSSLWV